MSIYIVCLLCLLVGGALGAYMGYRVGFAKGNLHSLYKSAAAAAKREEDKFEREIEELRRRVAEREAMEKREEDKFEREIKELHRRVAEREAMTEKERIEE